MITIFSNYVECKNAHKAIKETFWHNHFKCDNKSLPSGSALGEPEQGPLLRPTAFLQLKSLALARQNSFQSGAVLILVLIKHVRAFCTPWILGLRPRLAASLPALYVPRLSNIHWCTHSGAFSPPWDSGFAQRIGLPSGVLYIAEFVEQTLLKSCSGLAPCMWPPPEFHTKCSWGRHARAFGRR